MNRMSRCSDAFKTWWKRGGKHYHASLFVMREGDRYTLLWHAYKAGWNGHKRQAVQGQVLGSPGLPATDPGNLDLQRSEENADG